MTHTFRFLPSSSFDTMADSPSLWLPSSPEPEEDAAPSSRSGSMVSLPSCSDDDEVILPDTSEECCQMGCLSNIQADRNLKNRYDELVAALNDTTMADKDKLRYDMLRLWQQVSSTPGWRRWKAWGIEPCCRGAMRHILQLSQAKMVKFCKHLADGFMEPPVDMRRTHQATYQRTSYASCV